MKLKLNKLLLVFGSLVSASAIIGFTVASVVNVNNQSLNILNNNKMSVLDGIATASGTNYIVNINGEEPDSNSKKQYYAMNTANDSYAIMTSTSNSTGGNPSIDGISKFILRGEDKGKEKWHLDENKIKDASKPFNATTTSGFEIVSIAFSDGPISSTGYLYVLYKDSNKTYLAKFDWETGNKIGKSIDLNSDAYNFIAVVNGIQDNVILFKFDEIPVSGTSNPYKSGQTSTIDYRKIKDGEFNTSKNQSSGNNTKKTITIPEEVVKSHFTAEKNYVRDILFKNGNLYVAYQAEKVGKDKTSHAILKIAINSSNDVINEKVSYNDVISNKFNSEDESKFTKDKKLFLNLVDKGNAKDFAVFLKAKEDTGMNGSYFVSTFSSNDFNLKTTRNDNYQTKGSYVSQIRNYYANNGKQSGFIGLDSSNKVVLFDQDLNFVSDLYNFSSTAGNTNKVYNISTVFGDTDWYPQDTDGKIADFFKSTFIGQLDTMTTTSTKELLVNYSFFNDDEVPLSVRFRKITSNGSSISDEFQKFLETSDAYKNFLNISQRDTRFPEPNIKITPGSVTAASGDGNYSIDLTFKQVLRERGTNGEIKDSSSEIELGKKKYTFISGAGEIKQILEKNRIPNSILNSLPSSLTEDEVKRFLFDIKNVENISLLLNPNDTQGTLGVTVNVPYIWNEDKLETNVVYNFEFGSATTPFFKMDPLASYDTSVNLIDQEYLEKHKDDEKVKLLSVQFATSLPSQISKKQYLESFVLLGSAFNSATLVNGGKISPPSEENIKVTPIDNEGVALIDLTIPKIGDKTNIKYSFITAKVFKVNIYANNTFFFNFKSNDEVLENQINDTTKYKDAKPSQLLVLFQNKEGNELKEILRKFANFSNYFGNLLSQKDESNKKLVNVVAKANDFAKTLTIDIIFQEEIPTMNGRVLTQTFTDFWQGNQGLDVVSQPSDFKFGEISARLESKSPSEITLSDLMTDGVFIYSGSAGALEKEIKLNPINVSGTLEVTVIFKNWIEKGDNNKNYIVPIKVFKKSFVNLVPTKDLVNMLIWKSYEELESQYKGDILPSLVVKQITESVPEHIDKLKTFATLNEALEMRLLEQENKEKLEVSLAYDDFLGTIVVLAKITLDDTLQIFNTTISGFSVSTKDFGVLMVDNESEVANSIKNKLPSQATDADISKLYTIPTGNWFEKEISVNFNDVKGFLEVSVSLMDKKGYEIANGKMLYTGFETNIPKYKGTNWFIFGLSVAIPTILLLIPILVIKFVIDRKRINNVTKRLDSRLTEQSKKKKSKTVNSIKDLLDN